METIKSIDNDIKGSMDVYSIAVASSPAGSMDLSGSNRGTKSSIDKHEDVLLDSRVSSFFRPSVCLCSMLCCTRNVRGTRKLTRLIGYAILEQICLPLTFAHFKALGRILERRKIAVVFVDCRPTLHGTERRIGGCVRRRTCSIHTFVCSVSHT